MNLRKLGFTASVGALLGLSAMVMPAAAATPAAGPALQGQPGVDYQIVPAGHRNGHGGNHNYNRNRGHYGHYNRHYHGDRCRSRHGNCRHYHNGWYYSTPWWIIPPIVGGVVASQTYYSGGGYSSSHVRWCESRYRSYDPRSNTWVSYSGAVRQCVSPYSR